VLKADLPLKVKIECVFHLTNNFAYLFLVILAALQLPNLLMRQRMDSPELLLLDVPLFFTTCISIIIFYLTTHNALYGNLQDAVKRLPVMMAVSIGLSINNARAVLEGLLGIDSDFVRTPKHGVRSKNDGWITKKYRAGSRNLGTYMEIGFGIYTVGTILFAIVTGAWISIPFLVLFMIGFLYVGTLSLHQFR
jgi:hypothetical protein